MGRLPSSRMRLSECAIFRRGRPTAGAALLLVYTLGLGLPFLVCGLAFGALGPLLGRMRRWFTFVTVLSAIVMLAFGYLLLTNQLATLSSDLSSFLSRHGLDWLVNLG